MEPLNQSLKKGFEQKYAGAKATVSNAGTAAALEAVAAGKSDLAAIGRPLTDAEKPKAWSLYPWAGTRSRSSWARKMPTKGFDD
ncbi:MAG: hypothetical protein HC774_05300 [Sphingomonadales bacterium]|nr:hypothetical protein [Sphingomonadales bacterium]